MCNLRLYDGGCFRDSYARDLNFQYMASHSMSYDMCNTRCQGYAYFGIQSGIHCFCGDTFGRYGEYPATSCNSKCPVPKTDAAQVAQGNGACGGRWANSVFKVNSPKYVHQYLGCFVDAPDRDIPKLTHNPGGTPGSLEQYKLNALDDKQTNPFALDPLVATGFKLTLPEPVPFWSQAFHRCFQIVVSNVVASLHPGMTLDMCRRECSAFKYYALQSKHWCACGDTYGKHGKASDPKQCSSACNGAGMWVEHQACGGTWRNSVYSQKMTLETAAALNGGVVSETLLKNFADDDLQPPGGSKTMGCYDTVASSRSYLTGENYFASSSLMTNDFCGVLCVYYKYYFTSQGNQCWCDNTAPDSAKLPTARCSASCAGGSGYCGGISNEITFNSHVVLPKKYEQYCAMDFAINDIEGVFSPGYLTAEAMARYTTGVHTDYHTKENNFMEDPSNWCPGPALSMEGSTIWPSDVKPILELGASIEVGYDQFSNAFSGKGCLTASLACEAILDKYGLSWFDFICDMFYFEAGICIAAETEASGFCQDSQDVVQEEASYHPCTSFYPGKAPGDANFDKCVKEYALPQDIVTRVTKDASFRINWRLGFEGYIKAGINIEVCVFGICLTLWQAHAYARVQYWYLDTDYGQTQQLPDTSGHYMTVNVHMEAYVSLVGTFSIDFYALPADGDKKCANGNVDMDGFAFGKL